MPDTVNVVENGRKPINASVSNLPSTTSEPVPPVDVATKLPRHGTFAGVEVVVLNEDGPHGCVEVYPLEVMRNSTSSGSIAKPTISLRVLSRMP